MACYNAKPEREKRDADISEGLPKEIELRQKQYAYYRDRLLTFPKHEN